MYYEEYDDVQEQKVQKLEKYAVLTPSDVMEILGIGKNTMYDLLNSGKLVGFRVGRSWRISADALDDFMQCCPHTPYKRTGFHSFK